MVNEYKCLRKLTHNLKVVGSNPTPATNKINNLLSIYRLLIFMLYSHIVLKDLTLACSNRKNNMGSELIQFKNSSIKKGSHMLFICVAFPFAMWGMIYFFSDESIQDYMSIIYIITAIICVVILLIGVLPQLYKKRTIYIAINKSRIKVFFTDTCDYELMIQDISQIRVVTHSQRTTMKDYTIIDKNGEAFRLPHYYDVPINKIIKLLIDLNPQIERINNVQY